MSQIQIRDTDGRPIPRMSIRIAEGHQDSDAAIFDLVTDLAGNQGWPIPFWPRADYTLHINKQDVIAAFKPTDVFVSATWYDSDVFITLERNVPPRPVVDLRALHADGPLLRLPDGTPWPWKLVTAFDAPRLFVNGEFNKLRAYAQWTRDVGGNGWRMFGGWSRTGFDFRATPDYFRYLDDLYKFLGDEGLRGELSCICDAIPSAENEQRDFLERCADVLSRHPHAFFWYGNEPWKNGIDPLKFDVRRTGLVSSRGAQQEGAALYLPSLGVTSIHPPRTNDWARKCGKDAKEVRDQFTHDVVIPDEPKGFWESSGESGSRTGNVRHAFAAGVGAGLFCPGVTAHGDSDTMQLCNVPGPHETECVREMFRGRDLVPLDAPLWTYARYGNSNPGVPMPIEDDGPVGGERLTDHMHCMMNANTAVVCNYFPSAGWIAQPANGWHIVKQDSSFVLCER